MRNTAALSNTGLAVLLAAVLFVSPLAAQPMAAPTAAAPSGSQAPQFKRPLRVATRIVKPFAFRNNGRLTGYSLELWDAIAQRLGIKYQYVERPTVDGLFGAVKTNQADLAVAAISITAERDRRFDFSQPIYDAGLQIMVNSDAAGGGSFGTTMRDLFSSTLLKWILAILALIAIPAHLVWLFERRHADGLLERPAYFPGIFKAAWWAAGTLATQAEEMPRSVAGRIIAVVWMFASVVFVAYFTATVTSSLTVQKLHGDIQGPEDLMGKTVGAVKGSTALQYLQRRPIQTLAFANVEEAYRALERRSIDAVVYDAPILLYYASHEGKGKVEVVGAVFRKESYGILFPPNSPYRKPINNALLQVKEDGTYQKLLAEWFNSAQPGEG